MVASVAAAAIPRGTLVCDSDELSYNVVHNRIIRSSLRHLSEIAGLHADLRHRLMTLYKRLEGVSETRIDARSFSSVRLHRNNRFYGFLMNVCRLIHDELLPDPSTGQLRIREFIRDEGKMRLLFQGFVRNFLRRRLGPGFGVSASALRWKRMVGSDEALSFVPGMHTDVTVKSKEIITIIDTKYTPHILDERHGVRRVRSEHLYQLYAYLSNFESDRPLRGLLLYPQADSRVRVDFSIMGYPIRVGTIDLGQDWQLIERELIDIVVS
jgi:5-methylcytosine-specific restriction enzyme subunit McrC